MAASRSSGWRQSRGLDIRVVGHPGVPGRYPPHRGIEVLEQLLRDAGGNFCAVAKAAGVFVSHDDAARSPDTLANRFPVVGREGTEVQNLH